MIFENAVKVRYGSSIYSYRYCVIFLDKSCILETGLGQAVLGRSQLSCHNRFFCNIKTLRRHGIIQKTVSILSVEKLAQ